MVCPYIGFNSFFSEEMQNVFSSIKWNKAILGDNCFIEYLCAALPVNKRNYLSEDSVFTTHILAEQ